MIDFIHGFFVPFAEQIPNLVSGIFNKDWHQPPGAVWLLSGSLNYRALERFKELADRHLVHIEAESCIHSLAAWQDQADSRDPGQSRDRTEALPESGPCKT